MLRQGNGSNYDRTFKRCVTDAGKSIPDIGHAKRQTKHKAAAYFIQFQAMSAVEEARGAEGARAAEDALAARPLPKTRPMESDLTMLFITYEEPRHASHGAQFQKTAARHLLCSHNRPRIPHSAHARHAFFNGSRSSLRYIVKTTAIFP